MPTDHLHEPQKKTHLSAMRVQKTGLETSTPTLRLCFL